MEISPLAVDMKKEQIMRLQFTDSEEEEGEGLEAVTPSLRTDARSPENNNHSNVSVSSTETVPTAREVTRNVAVTQEGKKDSAENSPTKSTPGESESLKENRTGDSNNDKVQVVKDKSDNNKEDGSVCENMKVVSNFQKDGSFSGNSSTAAQTPVLNDKENIDTTSKQDAQSEEILADRAEFLKTLHDTSEILLKIKSSMEDPVVRHKVSEDNNGKMSSEEMEGCFSVRTTSDVEGACENQKQELNVSNSTVELLTADVDGLDLSDSGCRGRAGDSSDRSGALADISSSVHSSAILKDNSRESLRDDFSFPTHQDYIPQCNTTDSVNVEISSVENSLQHEHYGGGPSFGSPILQVNANISCHTSGHSSDHQTESSYNPMSSYNNYSNNNNSSSCLTDSVSFHERDSGCSPRKHKRRDRRMEAANQLSSSSSASQSMVIPEGSYAGQGKHRDRSYLGKVVLLQCFSKHFDFYILDVKVALFIFIFWRDSYYSVQKS